MDFQRFYMGEVFDAYKYLGAHITGDGVVFRTFAPSADRVTVIGEWNNWQEQEMLQIERPQFYEITVNNAKPGQMYKYVIYGQNGRVEHCDPYGFGMELRPAFASIICDLNSYLFDDEEWMQARTLCYDKPLNIYELHLGSWKRKDTEAVDDPDRKVEDGWYQYDEIADDLIAYVKENHYTHVEFMPLSEHPFDGSWGYQNTGFFSPTSRYGTAQQLKALIDKLHRAGIGAIIDFVPAHFAMDYYGLRKYDGTDLYEYPASDVSDSEWGTCNFIFARREVASFMQSAANYWLSEYHFDGLRMDAISRIIYWMGDENRGVNETSVDFLKKMNFGLRLLHPTAMLIAEDSTSYPGCTTPVDRGGLGYDYKWDLGWMNDTLDYFKKQSGERKSRPELLTFSMYYFYNERHLLPFSHDEVVHGKKTIIDKIFGDYEMKFPQVRTLYMYMMVHPGKMLNFMGNEIAMFREWDETREPDNFLLKYPLHDSFHKYIEKLNEIYEETPALYEKDYDASGFEWTAINDNGNNVYGIRRNGVKDSVISFFNFSDEKQYFIYTPGSDETLTTIINTDWYKYSGQSAENEGEMLLARGIGGAEIHLPPFSAVMYKVTPGKDIRLTEMEEKKAREAVVKAFSKKSAKSAAEKVVADMPSAKEKS